jgi:hypothetical protein
MWMCRIVRYVPERGPVQERVVQFIASGVVAKCAVLDRLRLW